MKPRLLPGAADDALPPPLGARESGTQAPETHEAHDPPISLEDEAAWPHQDGGWRTSFPPPENFTGVEHGQWGDHDYERDCTAEEAALLDAAEHADRETARTAAATRRDAWFASLRPLPIPEDVAKTVATHSKGNHR